MPRVSNPLNRLREIPGRKPQSGASKLGGQGAGLGAGLGAGARGRQHGESIMANWIVKNQGGLRIYQAATVSWLPGIIQGCTTRQGGVSAAPYESLNLSLACGDIQSDVLANRARLAQALGIASDKMVYAEQPHGAEVVIVEHEQSEPVAGADALITAVPGLLLTMLFADCMPIYIVEPVKKIVALIHSGWRGTAANIIHRTAVVLKNQLDVSPRACYVAIGPSIGETNYEVGAEGADRFRDSYSSLGNTPVMLKNEMIGTWTLNLRSIAFSQLINTGYRPESIAVCDEDTYANSKDFFSHRRESHAGMKTGRMAAILGIAG